tara:strand:- start:1458 stop:1649 length:192 start_codon:yes stop_codon:yes gene_type:complete
MKATIEIVDGAFSVTVSSKKTSYKATGTIVLDEDAQDIRQAIEKLSQYIISKSDNYTQSKGSI